MDGYIAEQFYSALCHVDETLREVNALCHEQTRPFFLLKPVMVPDGNQWCALYGENLQEGVAAFGDTPELAAHAFDKAWLTESRLTIPAAKP